MQPAMVTVGIDLASQASNTAACAIEWGSGEGQVTALLPSGVTDEKILEFADDCDKLAIDVPFGWPTTFVEAVSRHSVDATWPVAYRHHQNLAMRFRRTDLWVQEVTSIWPLSVSSDRIALPAMRAAALLAQLESRGPRDGTGWAVEVYPAAALKIWGLPWRQYKRKENSVARKSLLDVLLARSRSWLRVSAEQISVCEDSDDALDALVAALVARAAALGLVGPIPAGDQKAALQEGWIALPSEGSFERLGG